MPSGSIYYNQATDDPYYIDPYSGAPLGVSNTAWNNGSYVRNSQGTPVYVGYQPELRETNPGWVGASNGSISNQAFITADKTAAQYDYDRQNLLRNSNIAQVAWQDQETNKQNTIPGYKIQPFNNSSAYTENRTAAQNLTGSVQKALADIQMKQEADEAAAAMKQQALLRAQSEAASRIHSNDNALVRQSAIENRMIALRNDHPDWSQAQIEANVDRNFSPLDLNYLKSIDLVASETGGTDNNGGVILKGIGSSNFNPATGNVAITDQQRQDLVKFRTDLQNHVYDKEIAAGVFSPSGTGLEGYDGKPISSPNMYKDGQMYAINPSGNFSATNPVSNATSNAGSGALDNASYGTSQTLLDAINKALGTAGSVAQTPAAPAAPIQATGARASNAAYSGSGVSGPTQARAGGTKESVISTPKVTYATSGAAKTTNYNPIRYA